MKRLLTVGLMSAIFAGCVADPVTSSSGGASSNPQGASSSVGNSSSSVVSSSSVISSAPISSSSSSQVASNFNGDAVNGKVVFEAKCDGCHLDDNGDGFFDAGSNHFDPDSFGAPGGNFANYDGNSKEALASFITDSMSLFVGGCDKQCGEDTAAYLWLQRNGIVGPVGEALSCANPEPDAIHYGRRTLQVLTSYEYNNALKQLFNAPLPADYSSPAKISLDTQVARLPNHVGISVSETRMNAFYDNAVELADWAVANPSVLPFSCGDADSCLAGFVNEFAYVAYRRLLTTEEVASYKAMISEASDLNTGLKWAITTALTSPNFIYRSELGRTVAEALNEEAPMADPSLAGLDNVITVNMGEANYDASGFASYNANQYLGTTPKYTWTGNDIVKVSVSGNGGTFGFKVDNKILIEREITKPETLTFNITHTTGTGKYIQTWRKGAEGSLKVSRVTIGAPGTVEPIPAEDKSILDGAEPNAYVLTRFEYASALAFALTGSAPTRELLDAAKANELSDKAKLEQYIDDMIDSDLGKAHVQRLAGKWFRTDGLASKTRNAPEYTNEVRDSMMQEIREIYKHVFYNGDFPSMYAGDFTFLDKTLADFYGMAGKGGSSHGDFKWADTSGTLRGGIIASGGFMAFNAHMDYTSPILRSTHFRQDVLCQAIPSPASLEDSEDRAKANQLALDRAMTGDITTTDFFDLQTNIAGTSCASCHNAIINPLFAIDDFDNVGRLRKRVGGDVVQDGLIFINGVAVPQGDADLPIDFVNKNGFLFSPDVVGSLSTGQADADKAIGKGIAFSGSKDLGQKIVAEDLPGISACLIEKTTRFATGYTLRKDLLEETERSGPSYLNITNAQEAEFICVQDELNAAYNVAQSPRDVLKALVKSSAFRFRK